MFESFDGMNRNSIAEDPSSYEKGEGDYDKIRASNPSMFESFDGMNRNSIAEDPSSYEDGDGDYNKIRTTTERPMSDYPEPHMGEMRGDGYQGRFPPRMRGFRRPGRFFRRRRLGPF